MIIHSNLQVPAPVSNLQPLPDTTQRMRDTVSRLVQDCTAIQARAFMSRLETVIDELISNLVPLMAAEELVLCPRLARDLGDPLKEDHREVRGLVEQLSMLSEGFARRSRRTTEVKQMLLTALKHVTIALDVLGTHQQAAVCHLSDTLSLDEQTRLAATLEAAALDAREQTILIVQPAIPPGAAHVLRNRPDLNTAHAMSLANIERRVHGGAASEGETNHVPRPPSR